MSPDPDKPTEFESDLAELPMRSAPPELRNEILRNAEIVEPRRSWLDPLRWLWQAPAPLKFGALTIWTVALALGLTTPAGESLTVDLDIETQPEKPATLLAFNRAQMEQLLETETLDF